jgi:hypothetical protein
MHRPLTTGIIVGLNVTLEYLLPFFYLNLRLHSSLPIVFFDFGMSVMGRSFCEKRGEVISINESLYTPLNTSARSLKRSAWFKKPLACKQSPFDINLWLDLDCLIRGPLEEIFSLLTEDKWIVITQEYLIYIKDPAIPITSIPIYNAGVFAFIKNSPFIDLWIALSQKSSLEGVGDQDILSFELFKHADKVAILSSKFNHILALKHPLDLNEPLFDPPEDIVSSPLYDLTSLIEDSWSKETAHILHFAANLKCLLLARYQSLEALTSHKQVPHV